MNPEEINPILSDLGSMEINQKVKAFSVLSRPNISIKDVAKGSPKISEYLAPYDEEIVEQAEIEMKYQGYIHKEQETADKVARLRTL